MTVDGTWGEPAARLTGSDERTMLMTVPSKADVDDATRDVLAGLCLGDLDVLDEMAELRRDEQERSGLDARTFSLVKIAALIAVDAPPASYLWQVANALDSGATPEDLVGVLRAIMPQVGGPRAMAAAPEIMTALGLELPAGA
jgi:4-carboxymuconolactone decarboxylase